MISEHTASPLVLRPQVLTWHLCLLSFFHPQRQRCWSSQTTDVWHGFEQKCWTSSSVSSDFLVCLQEVPVEEQSHKLPPSSKSMNGGESLTPAGYCVLKFVCCSILLWTVCDRKLRSVRWTLSCTKVSRTKWSSLRQRENNGSTAAVMKNSRCSRSRRRHFQVILR